MGCVYSCSFSNGSSTSSYYWPAYIVCGGRLVTVTVCVVVCNTRICNVTHQGAACDGWPVVLRPVRATPCYCTTAVCRRLLFSRLANAVRSIVLHLLQAYEGLDIVNSWRSGVVFVLQLALVVAITGLSLFCHN